MTSQDEPPRLLDDALQRAKNAFGGIAGDPTLSPARDEVLEQLAADFIARVKGPAPRQFANAVGGCWIVLESRLLDLQRVVAVAQDGTWRLGEITSATNGKVKLGSDPDESMRGRPPAAYRMMGRTYPVQLREALASQVGWLQASKEVLGGQSGSSLQDVASTDARLLQQLPTLLANELARLLGEDEALNNLPRAQAEPTDPEAAASTLIGALLDALRLAGSPGIQAMPQADKRGFGMRRGRGARHAYRLDDRKAVATYSHGDLYQPTLWVWMTVEGLVEVTGDGQLAAPLDVISVAAMFYRYAASHGVRPPVPRALRTHWNWPEAFR